MMFMILGIGLFLLPVLFRLALKLRLGIPMLYALLALTVFHGWYQAHTALADVSSSPWSPSLPCPGW